MTLSVMRSHVYSGIRDPSMSEMSAGTVNRLLNDGVRDIVIKTGIIRGRWERSTVVGTELYALPTGSIRIIQLTYDIYRLSPTLDFHINIRNQNIKGVPSRYYPVNGGFGLHPIPSEVKTLKIEASRFPDNMSLDGTECPLPVEMHQLPVMFAIYRASFVYEPQNTELYLNRYLQETKRITADVLPEQLDQSLTIIDVGPAVRGMKLYSDTATVGEAE